MTSYAFTVQDGKIQPPLLPLETLRRDRLLDWLHAKIRGRLVLIVADPGYGKTTLLADWSRRTHVRTAWYRLDEHDRDWMVFIRHLVAAGREVDAGFAPNTAALVAENAAGFADRDVIVRTFLSEVRPWAHLSTALVFDDYQAVDEVPEIRELIRELVVSGPERLSIVISTRTRPTLPIARLRAIGEAAELGTDDLRFDRAETRQLFHETYGHQLEPDLLETLVRTTDGWAATLRLTESAVRGRPRDEVRSFIRSLSGREGDVHDYLAEEVVGRLTPEHQTFAVRCAVLEVATPELAAAAADVSRDRGRAALEALEAAGLLARRGRSGQAGRLFHPLVRSFLEARLLDEVGEPAVREIHARVGAAAENLAWGVAARHYVAANRPAEAARVLRSALSTILGSGVYIDALRIVDRIGPEHHGAWVDVLRAYRLMRVGEFAAAVETARGADEVVRRGDVTVRPILAALTQMNAHYAMGRMNETAELVGRIRELDPDGLSEVLAGATGVLLESMLDGDITSALGVFLTVAEDMERLGHSHFEGIARLNAALLARCLWDVGLALDSAERAAELLRASSSGVEVNSARVLSCWAYAHSGEVDTARAIACELENDAPASIRYETLLELAEIVGLYVDHQMGVRLLSEAESVGTTVEAYDLFHQVVAAQFHLREGRTSEAVACVGQVPPRTLTNYPGFYLWAAQVAAMVVVAGGGPAEDELAEFESRARLQNSPRSLQLARDLRGLSSTGATTRDTALAAILSRDPGLSAQLVEIILAHLEDFSPATLAELSIAAAKWRGRWRPPLRLALEDGTPEHRASAGRLLEKIGEHGDVARLRNLSKRLKGKYGLASLGRALARSLAPRLVVEDLGRVSVKLGNGEVDSVNIRPKALALLCLLAAQPHLSASREQVMDALWPESDPDQAINSLHQTSYFLRRNLEHPYDQDTSAGYLYQEGEILGLDSELVDSSSRRFRDLAATVVGDPDPDIAERIAVVYTGVYATDFPYDDWALTIRNALHTRYVEIVERAVRRDMNASHHERALGLARRMLEVDPGLDEVERLVVKLFRLTGRHAAAAEQYVHYAASVTDLGLEPPSIENV
jgi:DNA-binding SARP family transcriptional activator